MSAASVALLLGLGFTGVGCGSSPDESVQPATTAIQGGELATEHESVFGLVIHLGRAGATCTATLLAPNLLLTARHCVAPSPSEQVICGSAALGESFPAEDLFAANAVSMSQATRWFQGASVHVPTEGNDTCGYDVALVVLNENVPASVATPSVPRIDRAVQAGESYVAVGYGRIAEDGESGSRMVRGDLRIDCTPGTCGFGIRTSEFRGQTGICEGDSGGPAFDAQGKVVGVVSRGAEDCDSPVYGAVAAWKDLITEVALVAAARGRYAAPFWATSGVSDPPAVPEPSGELGDACDGASDCGDGFVCYRADGESAASCVARCSTDADCGDGLDCRSVDDGAADLCLAPRGADGPPDSSCSVGAGPSSAGAGGFGLLALAGAGLSARRRRR